MKKTFLILISLITFKYSNAQGADTLVTNLNLRSGTIQYIIGLGITENILPAYIKWNSTFRGTNPADNANVNIDTVYTTVIADAYRRLIALPQGYTEANSYITDMKASLASKRATNLFLDQLMDAIEAEYTSSSIGLKNNGNSSLYRRL